MPMNPAGKTPQQLIAENADLRARLDEAEDTLRAIRSGEVDALVVSGVGGEQLFTLKGADQSYRILIEEMSEGALTLTKEGVILFANRSLAGMLRTPLEKVTGSTLHTWVVPGSEQVLQVLLSRGAHEACHGELALVASDGTQVPVYVSANSLPANGVSDSLCLVVTDLTEQKRSESIIASEKAAQALLAASSEVHRELLSVIEDQRRSEEVIRQLNAELEDKVLARTAALERARLEAERASRAKSEFLSNMSHEIRTPMNGVIGMLDVLQQSSLSGQQIEMVKIIHDSAYSLLGIINDILDFSKIEAGKLQIDSVPLSVAEVVEGACATLDNIALKKGVELTLFTDPAIPAAVMGDAGRLRQILLNLAGNAIKFSSRQPRPGKVSVRAVRVEGTPEQATLEFRIADNGIGMDETIQARLFTAFTQTDSSTTRIYGGTGLGLAISGHLAAIMGGRITVHSEPDRGSLFSVRLSFALPAQQPEAGEAPFPVAGLSCLVLDGCVPAPSPACGGRPGWGQDQASLADDLAAYLVHAGAAVERATDTASALHWIARHAPGLSVVVIDCADNAPLLDSLRAAARARPDLDARFVAIGRGQRREPRMLGADQVEVDGNALTRRTLLQAVAIAAGRAEQHDREELAGAANAKPAPLSRAEAIRLGNLILVAEDNEINQKVILHQLALLGQTADIAGNGREALERWRSGEYALLLADLHMPEMDGYELTQAIRTAETSASETRKPIIAFTANALKGEADHCHAVGMDDYLSKPVQLVNLKAMLEKWLPVTENRDLEVAPTPVGATSGSRGGNGGRGLETAPTETAQTSVAVDVSVLKALVGDDEEIIRDFLHDFRRSAAQIAAELRAACAAGEAAAAGALAHKLKSSARSVGALALGERCLEMEKAGKAGDSVALTALLPEFEQELAGVEGFLEKY